MLLHQAFRQLSLTDHVCVAAGHTQATTASIHTDLYTEGAAEYCNLRLLQLLKKASRHRGSAALAPTTTPTQQPLSHVLPGQDLHSLGRAHSALQYYAGKWRIELQLQHDLSIASLHSPTCVAVLCWYVAHSAVCTILCFAHSCQRLFLNLLPCLGGV